MTLRHLTRAALSVAVTTALVVPMVAASADTGGASAFSSSGVRKAGFSKMACTSYPKGRDITVTRKMYEIAQGRNISAKVMLAMFEAGWVESWLNNLPCGDRDSIGIFQMRPSMGWGTYAQLRDVTYQVNKFINVALPLEKKYSTAGQLAQAVERSGYPYRYDQVQTTAQKYINEAFQPYGPIYTLWQQLGGVRGSLGGPLTAESAYATGVRAVRFSNGIAFLKSGRAYAIWGDNYRYWLTTGGYAKYGIPTMLPKSAAKSPTGTSGLTQGFQRGWIYWSAKTKSRAVMPAMQSTFVKYGAEGAVGFPVGDTITNSAGTSQLFEKAALKIAPNGAMSKTAR